MTVEGHIENGRIVLSQEIALPEGMRVRVELLPAVNAPQQPQPPTGSYLKHYESIIGSIDDLPSDFAAQHDHYIHGTTKR